MIMIALLILVPLLAGVAVLRAPDSRILAQRIRWSAWTLVLATPLLTLVHLGLGPEFYSLPGWLLWTLDRFFMLTGVALALVLLYFCRRILVREWYIPVLILLQAGLMLDAELAPTHPEVVHPFAIDHFRLMMALIVGVVGGLICLHALPYMRDYHAHDPEVPDRQPAFYFVILLFLSAMFGLVFTNHLGWLFIFWEVTTLCSFWLISYAGTDEAIRNGFQALGLNLIGGVAFAAAILWLTSGPGLRTWELDQLVAAGQSLALIPAVLIAVAGLAKSAQLPFSSWLLGAMVAPTPVSALLHSSTMVKAGVFLLVELAPVFHGSLAGLLLSLIGGITFLIASLVAVNQRNAKRVLAYSTIANLGLIVMCAGVGTAAALWAAILLILFHAVAKALLFLAVGTTEHLIGSRDIEDMEGLVYRRPELAAMVLVGILGMFLAPFGMLLGKYTTFQAFLNMDVMLGDGLMLAVILAFGSAPTLFFWSKWMGKLVAMPHRPRPSTEPIARDEWLVLGSLTVITSIACALFPLADTVFVIPYTHYLAVLGLIPDVQAIIPWETVWLMTLMLGVLFGLPLLFWWRPPRFAEVSGYLSGANVDGGASYRGAMRIERLVESRGYYLTGLIHEPALLRYGGLGTAMLIALMIGGAAL